MSMWLFEQLEEEEESIPHPMKDTSESVDLVSDIFMEPLMLHPDSPTDIPPG